MTTELENKVTERIHKGGPAGVIAKEMGVDVKEVIRIMKENPRKINYGKNTLLINESNWRR